jgi:hypothetical protein
MELFNVPGVQPAMRSRAGSGGVAAAELCQLVDLDQRDTRRAIGNWLGFRGITAIIATVLVREVISITKAQM